MKHDRVMIIDYGSQYTQLITRRVRELKVYSEIFPFDIDSKEISKESRREYLSTFLSAATAAPCAAKSANIKNHKII